MPFIFTYLKQEIGMETHHNTKQIIMIEKGKDKLIIKNKNVNGIFNIKSDS